MESLQKINSILLFKVGPVLCCASSNPVESIITPPEITHPPGTSDTMPGIFKHNGKIIRLSDLRQKFGINVDDRKEPGRVIIANTSSQYTGFWVDEILDVIERPSQGWGMPPAYIPRDVFSGTLFYKDKIWLHTEFEKLLKMNECGYLQKFITSIKSKQESKPGTGKPRSSTQITGITKVTNSTNTTNTIIATTNTTQYSEDTVSQKTPVADTLIEKSNSNAPSSVPSIGSLSIGKQEDNTGQGRSPVSGNILPDKIQTGHAGSTHKPGSAPRGNSAATPYKMDKTIVAEKQGDVVKNEPTASKTQPFIKTGIHTSLKNIIDETQNASTSKPAERIVTPNNSSLMPGFLLVVVISTITFLLYLVYEWSTPDKTRTSDSRLSLPVAIKAIRNPVTENTGNIIQSEIKESITQHTPATMAPDAIGMVTDVVADVVETERQKQRNDIVLTTEHHAVIRKVKDGIIIELDRPGNSEKGSDNEEEIATLPKHNQSSATILSDESTLDPRSTENTEFIEHTVVKGDTLWAIAKHYVQNPFRYPELARLSDIKNPDLIYPGNRVLIIKYSLKERTEN